MSPDSTNAALNRLWVMHRFSLASYLASAPPCWDETDTAAASLLKDIADEQIDLADRLGKLIAQTRGELSISRYPDRFSGMHDLSVDYTWHELISYQQRTVEAITRLLPQLTAGTKAEAVAQECLGVAKAHLDSLQELAS